MRLVRSPLKSQEPSEAWTVASISCLSSASCWSMPFERKPLTALVDREGRIAISHAGVVDPLVFEADINALLAEWVSVQLILPTGANSSR